MAGMTSQLLRSMYVTDASAFHQVMMHSVVRANIVHADVKAPG